MKFIITLSLLICMQVAAFSQTNQKKVFLKLDDTMNAFNPTGTNTPYAKTSRGPNSAALTPRIELFDTKDGFTLRTDFHMRKYDDNFNLVWETDLTKNYTLQAGASSRTFGDDKNSFFIELTKADDAAINRINEKGQLKNTEIPKFIGSPFKLDHEIYFLGPELDKKAEKLNYQFTRIDLSSNSVKRQYIDIPTDAYEYKKEKSDKSNEFAYSRPKSTMDFINRSMPANYINDCRWFFLDDKGNRALSAKIYFKDLEGTKKKELVFQTIEIDSQGKLYDFKKWNIDPAFADDKRKFIRPTVAFDDVNNEVMLFCYMSIDSRRLNGLFAMKYDYGTQKLVYSKEYNFTDILNGSDARKTHSSISKSVGAVIPLEFTSSDYYMNKKDKVFTLQIITNYINATTTYYELKFDKYGDFVQSDLVEYETFNFNYHNGLKSIPKFHKLVKKDITKPHFTNARPFANDYIINNPNNSKDEIYAFPVDRLNYSFVVFYNEDAGEFSGLKLN